MHILPLLGLAVFGIFMIVIIVSMASKTAQNQVMMFEQIARVRKGRVVKLPGGKMVLHIPVQDQELIVDVVYSGGKYSHSSTSVSCELPQRKSLILHIYLRDVVSQIKAALNKPRIKFSNHAFDDRFDVQASDEGLARAICTKDTQSALLEMIALSPEISINENTFRFQLGKAFFDVVELDQFIDMGITLWNLVMLAEQNESADDQE